MTRPAVTVVVPFAGGEAARAAALAMLRGLSTAPGDELILADNGGPGGPARVFGGPAREPDRGCEGPAPEPDRGCEGPARDADRVTVVAATGERSPAHARNAGAARAGAGWILFLDADTRPPAGLLDAYFEAPVGEHVGALVGEIVPAGATTLAGRYGMARNFLGQRAHLAHPFRPRAAAANLLVRRAAFEAAGGFREGLRAAEDTDFAWRLQDLGWTLELRERAAVEHIYRDSIGELRAQWRAYAAGRAWLARQYPGFTPEPAVRRWARRALSRGAAPRGGGDGARAGDAVVPGGRVERLQFLALDALLALDELIGLRGSNEARR